MKCSILMGSPRKNGNTIAIVNPFMETLQEHNISYSLTWLYDKEIKGCIACRACQQDWNIFGCVFKDDAQELFDDVLKSDLIVMACPIYCWFCTPPMKAIMDRFMYGMNKYYGAEKGPSLWAGKQLAIITTCGYRPEKGADLFEEGMKRYCKHSNLNYVGMLAERDMGYDRTFVDDQKIANARAFARELAAGLA